MKKHGLLFGFAAICIAAMVTSCGDNPATMDDVKTALADQHSGQNYQYSIQGVLENTLWSFDSRAGSVQKLTGGWGNYTLTSTGAQAGFSAPASLTVYSSNSGPSTGYTLEVKQTEGAAGLINNGYRLDGPAAAGATLAEATFEYQIVNKAKKSETTKARLSWSRLRRKRVSCKSWKTRLMMLYIQAIQAAS